MFVFPCRPDTCGVVLPLDAGLHNHVPPVLEDDNTAEEMDGRHKAHPGQGAAELAVVQPHLAGPEEEQHAEKNLE